MTLADLYGEPDRFGPVAGRCLDQPIFEWIEKDGRRYEYQHILPWDAKNLVYHWRADEIVLNNGAVYRCAPEPPTNLPDS